MKDFNYYLEQVTEGKMLGTGAVKKQKGNKKPIKSPPSPSSKKEKAEKIPESKENIDGPMYKLKAGMKLKKKNSDEHDIVESASLEKKNGKMCQMIKIEGKKRKIKAISLEKKYDMSQK